MVNERLSLESNVREWYVSEYPNDSLGGELNSTLTFGELSESLWANENVYETMGVGDSVVRERLFERVAIIRGVTYETVYNEWVWSDY